MYIESKKTTTIIQKSLENISNVIPNIQFFFKKNIILIDKSK